jgi:hypothetical protein
LANGCAPKLLSRGARVAHEKIDAQVVEVIRSKLLDVAVRITLSLAFLAPATVLMPASTTSSAHYFSRDALIGVFAKILETLAVPGGRRLGSNHNDLGCLTLMTAALLSNGFPGQCLTLSNAQRPSHKAFLSLIPICS